MIWAGGAVLLLVLVEIAFLFSRRRFETGDVLRCALLSAVILSPPALAGGAISLLPNVSFSSYLAVLPITIAFAFWLDLTFGVAARMGRIPTRRRSAPRPAGSDADGA